MNKRVYIGNKTGGAITLTVDSSFAANTGTMEPIFKEELDGKHIHKGSTIIYFGKGKWNKAEEESLKKVLQHTTVTKDESTQSFKLPENMTIGHGLLIPELIVRINKP